MARRLTPARRKQGREIRFSHGKQGFGGVILVASDLAVFAAEVSLRATAAVPTWDGSENAATPQ